MTSSDCEGAGETFAIQTDKHLDALKEEDAHCDENEEAQTEASEPANSELNLEHFFKKPVYLTVSSQLHLEACALGVGDVYTLSPVFRAENNISRKHLSEFRMLEVETVFTRVSIIQRATWQN